MPDSFGGTISGGIQDVSAILPLLGTAQCEKHVGSSLAYGFLYAAVTPLSIFGSLGAVQATLSIGLASIPSHWGFGAQLMKNAGFVPTGDVALMITLDGQRYIAETRLLSLLEDHHIDDLDELSVKLNSQFWNTYLIMCSLLAIGLSLIPYLHFLIRRDTTRPLLAWLFPLIRAAGGHLCVVLAQFILQNRLLMILNQRILFMRIDRKVKEKSEISIILLEMAIRWGDQFTSEECLWSLHRYLSSGDVEKGSALAHDIIMMSEAEGSGTKALGGHSRAPSPAEGSAVADGPTAAKHLKDLMFQHSHSGPLVVWQFLIAVGMAASVVGYVGCFSLVQDDQSTTTGRYLWLGLEVLLSVARMMIWAYNPPFDDSEGMLLNIGLSENPPCPTKTIDGQKFAVLDERQFWKAFTAYCGPMERLRSNNIVFYYALIDGVNSQELYITLSDMAHKTVFLRVPETNEVGFCLYNATLDHEELTGDIQITQGNKLSLEHNLPEDTIFFDKLTTHHDFIMFMLKLGKHRANSMLLKVNWLLAFSVVPQPKLDEAWDIICIGLDNIMINIDHQIQCTDCVVWHTTATIYAKSDKCSLLSDLKGYFSKHVTHKKMEANSFTGDALHNYHVEQKKAFEYQVDYVNCLFTCLNRRMEDQSFKNVKDLALDAWKRYFEDCIQ